jgi:hypothetical protein
LRAIWPAKSLTPWTLEYNFLGNKLKIFRLSLCTEVRIVIQIYPVVFHTVTFIPDR